MNINDHTLAVCSWSLKPTDMHDLVTKVQSLELGHVQLMLLSLLLADDKRKHHDLGLLKSAGIAFTGGMMSFPGEDYSTIAAIRRTGGFRPDETWEVRKRLMLDGAALAKELQMSSVGVHIGFVPPSSEAGYATMVQRVCDIAQPMEEMGIALLMETGQETASELLQFLNDLRCRNVGVNFDPANMILYGVGDPIEAINVLGRHIRHVHVKDARLSSRPGVEWGEEVPFGTGQVPPKLFLEALANAGYAGPLAIEREAGDDRVADVATAIRALQAASAQAVR
jgi:sugar phosphate isomerase/epimerase